MEVSKEELLEERLVYVEEDLATQKRLLGELLEYLSRVDDRFKTDPATFDDWRQRLKTLQQEERVEKEVAHAKQCLAHHGYLVVKDMNDLDAARVKKWVETGKDSDDEPPF